MELKEVFKARIERATRVLENSEAEPRKIEFSSVDLSDPDALDQLHDQFPRAKLGAFYLYQLSINDEKIVASQAREAFRSACKTNTWNMSRDNKDHKESNALYVGTCESMYNRFRTHLGKGDGTTTWALYLSAWAVPLKAKFVVSYYEFKETISEDVELIEGVLWDSLKPLFGKKGGK